ncbi:snRNA-activating protein complex subunit 4 isoform X2 [Stegostoma tigrinum]|uniref:snRNA-activating protein complex subunit 4 isoform X2 n=1 Tax=Stegostoma tigrinum TaxID=3053191 RepID=UPI0028708B17|nr:snRNA-activating protein complex subunit 4 isoform X2 [Stegostoma tigrinum]
MADGPAALSGSGPGPGLGLGPLTAGSSRLDAAGPSDPLQAERERIRREILELEQRLGVAAGSELCGGTGSESDGEQDDEGECISLAFARDMVPQLPDSGVDDEGDELPEDPETCLQMNLVYQEVIVEKLQDLELLVSHNKEQQSEIMSDLARHGLEKTKSTKNPSPTLYLGHFLKPYFKDKVTSLGPPANQDAKEKATQGIKSFDEFLITSWKQKEKEKLRVSIASDAMQKLLQPKLLRLEYLNKKLELSHDETEKKMLTKQIGETEREMDTINQMSQRQLLGNRFDDHDWIKIANIDFDGTRKAEDIKNLWQNSEHPSINKEAWSKEEVQRMIEIAEQHGCVDWEWITSELQTNRTAFMCLQKYQEFNKELRKKEWTEEEDHMLTELVQKMRVGNFIPYTKIAYFMEGRNSSQLLYRWSKSLDPSVKKGPWTRTEDELLLKAVAKYGTREWFKIQEEVPGRVDAQCRGRFLNTLNHNLRKGRWTPEEERDFRELLAKHGVGRWSKIAAGLVGRTEAQCLHKWKAITGIKAKEWAQSKLRRKGKLKRMKKKRQETSSESSEFSSEDIELMESEEEQGLEQQQEEEEDSEESEEAKQEASCWNPAKSLVLDVDRWVPVVENEQALAGNSESCRASGTVTVKIEALSRLGRPKANRFWGRLSCRASAVPNANKTDKKETVRELAAQSGVPAPAAFAETAAHPTVKEVSRKPLRVRRGSKRTVRQICRVNLEKKLVAEMCRWTAAKMVNRREADIVRERLEATGLSTTPVFTLLVQLFRIDKEGCVQFLKKMNEDTQGLSEKEQRDNKPGQDPCSLQQVKDSVISVGSKNTMEVSHFKLAAPAPVNKPKTVLQLLTEKRKAQAAGVAPQSMASLAQLAASLSEEAGGCASETHKQSDEIKLRRRKRRKFKPRNHPSAQGATPDEATPNATAQPQVLEQSSTATAAQSTQSQPAVSSAMSAATAAVKPAASTQRRLKPIAPMPPAPALVLPSGMVVQLMLPNSAVPVMAVLTPNGLFCVPPGSFPAQPSPNLPPPATGQAIPSSLQQAATMGLSVVTSSSTVSSVAQAPASCNPASGQAAADGCAVALLPATSLSQTVAFPSPAIQTPAAHKASAQTVALTAVVPSPTNLRLPVANSISQNLPKPLVQGGGLLLTAGVPPTGPRFLTQCQETLSRPQPSKHTVDFRLLSCEQEAVMREWLQGKGGVQVPGMSTTLPYLPPFSSTLRAFSNLLLHKKALEQNLSGFGALDGTDPKERLEAARVLVTDRLQNDSTYQLLKSRFLSVFALPAFLATLPPHGTWTTVNPSMGAPDQSSEGGSECMDTGETEDSAADPRERPAADEVASRELHRPFEVSFTDLSFGCNLTGSLETVDEQPPSEQPADPEPNISPRSETEVVSRWNLRPRKKR